MKFDIKSLKQDKDLRMSSNFTSSLCLSKSISLSASFLKLLLLLNFSRISIFSEERNSQELLECFLIFLNLRKSENQMKAKKDLQSFERNYI